MTDDAALIAARDEDHARGCQGRQYSCTCGHDAKVEAEAIAAADRIAALTAERDTFYMDYRMKCDEETKRLHIALEQADRIAALAKTASDNFADAVEWQDRATAAEAEVAALRELLRKHLRSDSPRMDSTFAWRLSGGLPRARTADAAIDAARAAKDATA